MKNNYDVEDAARELSSTGRRVTGLALLAFVGLMLLILPLEGMQYLWAVALSFPLWGLGVALMLGRLKNGLFSSAALYVVAVSCLAISLLPVHDGPSTRMGALFFAAMIFAAARSRRLKEKRQWVLQDVQAKKDTC